ncbi:MAG: hypothetical protein ACK6D7_12580, partial [Acidobacteriota bacterium]
ARDCFPLCPNRIRGTSYQGYLPILGDTIDDSLKCIVRSLLCFAAWAGLCLGQDFSANAARRFSGTRQVMVHEFPVELQSAQVWNNGETVT